jgi:glycosyltransferase involved in cell wall biosynthesis
MISVVIPTYNRANSIARTIVSVINQTYTDWELIIIDDGSIDDTGSVVSSFQNPKIAYHYFPNQGASFARNKGIELAKGEYIAFLDSDDEWSVGRLKSIAELIGNSPYECMYITQYKRGSTGKNLLVPALIENPNFRQLLLTFNLLGGTSNIVVPRAQLLKIKGFDVELTSCQDHDLYIRLTKHIPVKYLLTEFTVFHTDTNNRISSVSKNKVNGHVSFFKKHRNEMTGLGKLISRKKIAILAYQNGDWRTFIKYSLFWFVVNAVKVYYRQSSDRGLLVASFNINYNIL